MKTLKHTKIAMMVMAATMVLGFSSGVVAVPGAPTAKGVQPVEYPGNFVSGPDDNQVCYDMIKLGHIPDPTGEQIIGVKIDPPVNFSDAFLNTTISLDGKYLDWTIKDGKVLAFIIKGGPNYNLYDYVSLTHTDDQLLHSPLYQQKSKLILAQISHYNACYIPEPGGEEITGCTRGYWSNHADRWSGVNPTDDFDATFGVDAFTPNITLAQAIESTGGGIAQLSAQAVAGLLNSYGGVANTSDGATVNYKYTTAEVITLVQDAVNTVDDPNTTNNEQNEAITHAKDLLDAANNAGGNNCPLSGTAACNTKNPAACLP